jgi:general secretion pathway protein D
VSLGEEEFEQDDEYDLSRRFRRFRVLEDNGGSSFLDMEPPSVGGSAAGGSRTAFSFSQGNALSRLSQWNDLRRRGRETDRAPLSASEAKDLTAAAAGGTNLVGRANVFVSLSRKNNMLIVRTSDLKVMDEVRRLVRRLDVPTPLVLMEVKVMELDVDDDYEANFSYWFNSTRDATGALVPTEKVAGQLLPEMLNPLSAATMGFQAINDRIRMQLSLMERDGKVRTLATPTLLVANNEVSRIFSGQEYPFVKGVTAGETVVSEAGHVTRANTVDIEWKDIGTMLLITPNINSDKTVTLRLLQENSERIADGATIPLNGSQMSERTPVDVIESRSVTGTFVAKDGMAVLAGGLIKETEREIYTRTPVLGSLPLVGWLFRGTEKVKRRTELLVTIRPHIISTPYEGGKISAELLKALSAHPAADGRPSLGVHLDPADRRTLADDVDAVIRDQGGL